MLAVGPGVCGTTMLAFPLQPAAFVAVTVYVPLAVTTSDVALIFPGVHTYDVPPLAVSKTIPPGSHTWPVIVIVGVGAGKILMVLVYFTPQTFSTTTAVVFPGPCHRDRKSVV